MGTLDAFVTTQLYIFLLIFARIGCAFMIMPGMSDATVPPNVRLYAALTFSFILTPVLAGYFPPIPTDPVAFGLLTAKEMLVGLFIGLMTQVMMNAINLLGVMISHATSLSSAFTFNPQYAAQSPVITGFLSLTVIVLLFVSDLHHMLFVGFVDSYQSFPPTGDLVPGDMTNAFAQAIGDSLRLGLMLSSPFIIVAFGVFLAMGLTSRLVPQIQVFVLSMPIQIITGLIVMMTTISAIMVYFMDQYSEFWNSFIGM